MMKIVLVDGNNLIFRSYYATAYNGNLMKNSKGFPTNALYGFINMINKIKEEENPLYMMIAFDKGKTFRHNEYSDYKGGRSETPDELKIQFPISRKICDAMGIKYLEIDNFEADDIIGTFSKKITELNEEALIVSSDKDLLQLINKNIKVKLLKTHDYIMMDQEEFKKTYMVDPINMIDLKALMGDASDNIPGVSGIGEKTAIKLLADYHNLDNLYNHLDEIKGKTKEKLIQDKDKAYLSYHLATIYQEVPIDTSLESIKIKDANILEYQNILKELEFFSLLKKFDHPPIKKSTSLEYQIINNLDELHLNDEYSLYLEVLGYNYHSAKALGVSIKCQDKAYFIPIDLLKESNIFNDGHLKYTYDLKKMLVVFDKYDILIDKNVHDLMIEGYLLNKNIKNDISYLANQYDYDIMFYDKEFGSEVTIHEIESSIYIPEMIKKSNFIYEYKNYFYNELVKEDMEKLYLDIEMPLVYVLSDMEITGFKVDKNYLLKMQEETEEKIKTIEEEIYNLSGVTFNIASPKQLADVLFNKMGIPYPKRVKGDKEYSTSKEILDKLKGKEIIVDKVLEYRKYSKILSSYIIGIINEIKPDGRIHTIYNQTLTRTGRLSSERPNLQNIPIRTDEGREIRKAFIPDDDSIIISSDYSQIELRVFAHIANAKNMIEAFKNDFDIHAKTASDIFHVPIDMVDKNMRRNAKAVNFGILYGISSFGLSEDLGINLIEAKHFIDEYLNTFPEIKKFMDNTLKEAYQNGYVKTLFNRKRVIDELKNKNYLIRSSGERMALNAPIQGTAADIIKLAMIKIKKEMDRLNLNSKMLVQVHDELVFTVPNNEAEIMQKLIKDIMENIYELSVPLKVDIEYGKTWYEAK